MWKGFFEYNINNVDTVGYIRITYKTVGTVEAKSKKYESTLFMVIKSILPRKKIYLLLSLTTTRCSTTKWTYFIVYKYVYGYKSAPYMFFYSLNIYVCIYYKCSVNIRFRF